MLPIHWSPAARADFIAVIGYISGNNADAAQRLHDLIEHAAAQISEHPYMYLSGRVAGTREAVVHPNYLLIYRVGVTAVEVLRVLHARQQYP